MYCSPIIISMTKWRRIRWEGHAARIGNKGNTCRILMEQPEGKEPLGIPRCRGEYNIKMDLQEIGWCVKWFVVAQYVDRASIVVAQYVDRASIVVAQNVDRA
jgi:hypothetical protein